MCSTAVREGQISDVVFILRRFFLKICKIALFNGVIYLSFSGPVIDRNDRK